MKKTLLGKIFGQTFGELEKQDKQKFDSKTYTECDLVYTTTQKNQPSVKITPTAQEALQSIATSFTNEK